MPSTHLQEATNPFIMYHALSAHSSIHNICYLILSAHVNTITYDTIPNYLLDLLH